MSVTARSIAESEATFGSYAIPALPAERLTFACSTPGRRVRAFSTLRTQAAQVMPDTGRVISLVGCRLSVVALVMAAVSDGTGGSSRAPSRGGLRSSSDQPPAGRQRRARTRD